MKREAKEKLVKELEESFDLQKTVYLLDYTKMTVSQAVELRKLLQQEFLFIQGCKKSPGSSSPQGGHSPRAEILFPKAHSSCVCLR